MHRPEQVADAQTSFVRLFGDLIAETAASGSVRADIDPGELANYCLRALSAAASLPSKAAVDRLITVTMTSLRTTHP